MSRSHRFGATLAPVLFFACAVTACDDSQSPSPSPDKASATSATSSSSSEVVPLPITMNVPSPTASASESAPEPTASASASAAPTATVSASASASPAPSASATAKTVKGFAFPSPKSGILTPAEADKIAPAGIAKVRLTDPGKEPLSAIVYKPSNGEVVPVRMDLVQKVSITAQGQPTTPVLSPPQALDIDVTTDKVDDSGAQVSMLLQGISLKPIDGLDQDTLGQLSKGLSGLRGYTMRQRVGSHGEVSESKVQLPPTAPQGAEMLVSSMGGVLRMMIPRVAEEPVGPGAKWQVLSREDHNGTSVVQLTEYTLKSHSGTTATLNVYVRQLAASDKIQLPTGAPPGVTTKLTKFLSTANGQLTIDTRQMAPTKGSIAQDSKLALDVIAPGQDKTAAGLKMKTDAEMKMTVTFSRRAGSKAPPAGTSAPSAAPAPDAPKTP